MASSRRKTKNLEFAVDDARGRQVVFDTFSEATTWAVTIAANTGRTVNLDVLAWSKAAARAWRDEEGVAQYEEDPDASVFERIEVRANVVGRVR